MKEIKSVAGKFINRSHEFILLGQHYVTVGILISILLIALVLIVQAEHIAFSMLSEVWDQPLLLSMGIISMSSLLGIGIAVHGALWSGVLQPWLMGTRLFYRKGWQGISVPILGMVGVLLALWGAYLSIFVANWGLKLLGLSVFSYGLFWIVLAVVALRPFNKKSTYGPDNVVEWGYLMECGQALDVVRPPPRIEVARDDPGETVPTQ